MNDNIWDESNENDDNERQPSDSNDPSTPDQSSIPDSIPLPHPRNPTSSDASGNSWGNSAGDPLADIPSTIRQGGPRGDSQNNPDANSSSVNREGRDKGTENYPADEKDIQSGNTASRAADGAIGAAAGVGDAIEASGAKRVGGGTEDAVFDKARDVGPSTTEGGLVDNAGKRLDSVGKTIEQGSMAMGDPAVGRAVGAGVRVAGTAIPKAVAIGGMLFVGLLAVFLLIMLIVSGGSKEPPTVSYVEPEIESEKIPEYVLLEYQNATRGTDIPWTVLAAIGEIATFHGSTSPYDSIVRDPDRIETQDARNPRLAGVQDQDSVDSSSADVSGTVAPSTTLTSRMQAVHDATSTTTLPGAATSTTIIQTESDVGGITVYTIHPTVSPPIGDAALREGQALGPMLLWPELVAEYPSYDPQNWTSALQVSVYEIESIRETMEAEGIRLPDYPQDDPEAVDDYWEAVVEQFRGGRDKIGDSGDGCGVANDATMEEIVATSFRCEANAAAENNGLWVVTSKRTDATTEAVTYTAKENLEAVQVLVDDAMGYAYAWSGQTWKNATLETITLPGCEEGALDTEYAGLFPITTTQASEMGISDRCDPLESTRKIAATVVAQASISPEMRVADTAVFDGWQTQPLAVGDTLNQEAYQEDISTITVSLTQEAQDACLVTWEAFYVGTSTNPGAVSITSSLAATDAQFATEAGEEMYMSGFGEESWVDQYVVMRDALHQQAINVGLISNAGEPTPCFDYYTMEESWFMIKEGVGTSSQGDPELDSVTIWIEYEKLVVERADASIYDWGSAPGVVRFATDLEHKTALNWHPNPPSAQRSTVPENGFGRRVVVTAIRLGGMFVGDERAGTQLAWMTMGLALMKDRSCGPAYDSECDAVTREAMHVMDNTQEKEMLARGELIPLQIEGGGPCGSFNAWGRPSVVMPFQAMCVDAAQDGITFAIGGSTRTYQDQIVAKRNKPTLAATPGNSYHEWGLALDLAYSDALEWMHTVVGCYSGDVTAPDPTSTYRSLNQPMTRHAYVNATTKPCNANEYPVKRMNTYGLVTPVCKMDSRNPEALKTDKWVMCSYEPWHVQPGISLSVTFDTAESVLLASGDIEGCYLAAQQLPLTTPGGSTYDTQLIGQMVYQMFRCVADAAGMSTQAPTTVNWSYTGDNSYRWSGADLGFTNLTEQIASEAVVVSFCESVGYDAGALSSNNSTGKYGGVFQMGDNEMDAFAPPGASKFDPVANVYGAARYYLAKSTSTSRWGGWHPWAVVNTDFGSRGGDGVRRSPVLPSYGSTDPDSIGWPGGELPQWAVNPFEWAIPGPGCKTAVADGQWPASSPLPGHIGITGPPKPATVSSSATSSSGSAGNVAIIGDSITEGSKPQLLEIIPNVRIDSEVGRNFSEASAALQRLVKSSVPETLVVALGTNNGVNVETYDAFILEAEEAGVQNFVIVNIRADRSWETDTNAAISIVASTHENVSLADWKTLSDTQTEWFRDDGIHPVLEGRKQFAQLISNTLRGI